MRADEILGFIDYRTETIDVPEWGTSLRVRGLGADHLTAYSEMAGKLLDEKGKIKPGARMAATDVAQVVVWGVVDETGARVFKDDHVSRLATKNLDALQRLHNAILRLSYADTKGFQRAEGN